MSNATKMPASFAFLSHLCLPFPFLSLDSVLTKTKFLKLQHHTLRFFMFISGKEPCEFQSPTVTAVEPQPKRKPKHERVSKKLASDQEDTPFRGVRKRSWGRYVSEIRLPGQKTRIWLGSFRSPEMAARAYDSAAFFLKGNSATLNFPDLVGSLPRPQSCSRRDIQSAAAKAASQESVGNRDRSAPSVSTVSDNDHERSEWWDDLVTAPFEEVKGTPSLCPLRFDSMDGELCFFMDHDDLLNSCFPLNI